MLDKPETRFLAADKFVEAREARKYPILVATAGMLDDAPNFAFGDQKSFRRWAENTKHGAHFDAAIRGIEALRKHEGSDVRYLEKRQRLQIERIKSDMQELADRTGLEPNSEELFLRGSSPSNPLEPRIFDPVTMFDGIGASGNWVHLPGGPIGGGWPSLGWFGFNDVASSIRISGFANLFEHDWFQGRNLWLAGHPIWLHPNLADFGFDNLTSSAWVA